MSSSTVISSPLSFTLPVSWTLSDLQDHLGGVSPNRVRLHPSPGLATEQDVLDLDDHEGRLCELVDGVLVEKAMGAYESLLAGILLQLLNNYLDEHDLGVALAPDGPYRLGPRRVRMPDVSFIRWDRLPEGEFPPPRVIEAAPDLAVEILSEGNTEKEMQNKLEEYFASGVEMVWLIDPRGRTARAFDAPDRSSFIPEDGVLDGGEVLPGFRLPLQALFRRAQRAAR